VQVTKLLGDLSQNFVNAVAPLRNKIDQVELWFDTVTQSFDERYERHMRTASFVISIVIVIVLNANFFHVYRSLSANQIQQTMVANAGADLLQQLREAQATQTGASVSNTTPAPRTVDDLQNDVQAIDSLTGTYGGFGFQPLTGEQLSSFFWGLGGFTKFFQDDYGHDSWGGFKFSKEIKNGKQISHWTAQNGAEWWDSRKDNVVTLVGWAIMIMLLSVGAPFWQDALESLFGIKNLLRQKSATQNIETQSGAGQPKE
jgi:hypothetical protein